MSRRFAPLLLAAALPACAEGPALQAEDFNHRRWTMELRDGQISLDFGERLFFEYEDGCRTLHGFARLQRDTLVFEADDVSGQPCDRNPGQLNPDTLVAAPWQARLEADGTLHLRQGELHFSLQRNDWL